MNDEFIQQALSNGNQGQQWLNNIPTIIALCEKQWHIRVLPPFYLSYNYVAPVLRADGSEAVIKIGFPGDKEFQTEIAALNLINGDGVEKLLEINRENTVILIEKVNPGIPLSTLEDDDEATRILARVMKRLWKPLPNNHPFIPLGERVQELFTYQQNHEISHHLIDKAVKLCRHLIATADTSVLVHGDLHHDNILSSDRTGWLAIDPKGVAAEPVFEVAAMIRNPYEKLRIHPDLPGLLRRRIHILIDELGFDGKRILEWCFVQTVLSGIWNIGSPKGPDHAIRIAEVLDTVSL